MADFFGWLGDLAGGLDDVWGAASTAAQLGSAGLGIWGGISAMEKAGQQQKLLERAQRAAQAQREAEWSRADEQWGAGAPLRGAGSALASAGQAALMGGPLPGPLEAQVSDWANTTRMNMRNYFAKAGIADSSMMAQYEGWIEAQSQRLRGQLASQLAQAGAGTFQAGMGGAQRTVPPESVLPSAAFQAASAGAGVGSMLEQASRALALLSGSPEEETKRKKARASAPAPVGAETWQDYL